MPNTITPQVLTSGRTLALRTASAVTAITQNSVQRVRVSAASGTYTLSWKGSTTGPLALGADPATVQAALAALPGVGVGNVAVSGTPGNFVVTATGALAATPQPPVTVTTSALASTSTAFGTAAGTSAAVSVEDGSARWDSSGPWVGTGFGSGSGHHEVGAAGAGDNWCSWTFVGRATGFYKAMLTYALGNTTPSLYAPAATYRLYDGPNYLGRYTLDLSQPPPADDPGTGLTGLMPAYVTSGTLTVYLDDADTSGLLNADVLTLVPADPTAAVTGDDIGATYAGVWSQVGGYPFVAHDSTVDGTSGQSATINLAPLPRATYALETTWAVNGSRSAQVRYRLYDGPTLAATVTVNQTAAPSGGTTRSGHGFFPLGSVACRTGHIRVVIDAPDSATKSIEADDVIATPTGPLGISEPVSSSVTVVNPGGPATYTINGGPPVTLGAPIWYDPANGGDPGRPLAHVIYPVAAAIAPTDAVLVTVPQGMLATAAGPTDALTGVSAANLAGRSMFPALAAVKTLKAGYNITTPNVITSIDYANYMKGGQDWGGDLNRVTLNSDGYPVFSAAGVVSCQVRSGYFNRADPRGFPSHGTTTLTLVWDGPGVLYLSPNAGTLLTQLTSDTGHATGNTRTYSLAPDTSVTPTPYGAGFACVVPSSGAGTPATYIGIFDATVPDPLNPPKFHAYFLRMLQGAKSIRFAFSLGTNSSSITQWAHYPTQTQRSYAAFDQRRQVFTIGTIGPFTDTRGWFPAGDVKMLVTLDRPHGLDSGTSCSFQPPAGGPEPGQIKVHTADGGLSEFEGYNLIAWYDSALMTTSQIAVSNQKTGGTAGVYSPVSPSYTYGGTVQVATNSTPVADAIDLCNAVGVTTAWLNIPPAASDSLLAQFGTACLGLNAGIKIAVEVSNEHWNYAAGFSQYFYYRGLGLSTGKDATGAYTAVSAHAHAVIATALGARAADLVRVFGTAAVVSSLTNTIVTECLAHSYPLDVVAPAPYTAVHPTRDARLGSVTSTLTAGQCHDVLDAFLLTDYHVATYLAPHWSILHAAFPSAQLWDYEGAISGAGMDTDDTVYSKQTQAVWQHPRFYATNQYYLDSLQRGHVSLHNHYGLSNVFIDEVVPSAIYGANQSWSMRPLINDGTQPVPYDPRPDLANVGGAPGHADMSLSSSNVGAAIKDWNAGVSAPQPAQDPGGTGGGGGGGAPAGQTTGAAFFKSSLFGSILIGGS